MKKKPTTQQIVNAILNEIGKECRFRNGKWCIIEVKCGTCSKQKICKKTSSWEGCCDKWE